MLEHASTIKYRFKPDSNLMRSNAIFIDESGDPGLKSERHKFEHPFFIVGFCYCSSPRIANRKLRKLLTKLHKKEIYPSKLHELKFHPSPALRKLGYDEQEIKNNWEKKYDYVRREIANVILKHADGIFAGVLDKRSIYKKTWTSERIGNYLFKRSLYDNILPKLNLSPHPSIIYDRGRLSATKTKSFNQYVSYRYAPSNIDLRPSDRSIDAKDADSLKMPGIWLGDFVAGSFHLKFQHDNSIYYDLLKPKFIGSGSLRLWF